MNQINKISHEADTITAPVQGGICLQTILNDILIAAGTKPQPLWRGYQLQDNKQADGTPINEKWKYVPEVEAAEKLQDLGAMFSTVCASTYRKDSQDVERSEALFINDKLFFDFDADDLDTVIPKVRQFIGKLSDKGLDPSSLDIFASGGKGFHVMVPLDAFLDGGAAALSVTDLATFQHLVKDVATQLFVDTLDMRIYTAGRMWRRPNVQRVSGSYKVPVTYSELMAMDADMYSTLVSQPREVRPRVAADFCPELGRIWSDARRTVKGLIQAKAKKAAMPKVEVTPQIADRYRSALSAVDPDADYQTWYAGVAATNYLFDGNDQGLKVADDWSRQSKAYNRQELETTWEALNNDLIGTGAITDASVYMMARESGWIDTAPELNPKNQIDNPQYQLRLTDEGFAEHVAAVHADDLRYISELNAWAAFDGRSWVIEQGGIAAAKSRAKTELRALQAKVAAEQPADATAEDRRTKTLKFLFGLENGRKLETIVGKMAAEPSLNTGVGLFDDRPYLVNLINGTYDLKRGQLRPHDPTDYLTQRINIEYDPTADCPRWVRFIDEITCGNTELADFLQCIAGLCLSGDVSRQEAYIMYGSGGNGKSAFTDIIEALCGDYYKPLDIDVLMHSNRSGSINTGLASLRGARAVATGELPRGVQLKSNVYKDLTGGDSLQVDDKYVRAFRLKPQCTILIPTNYLPTITENDEGTWRRTCIIPFRASFSGKDRDLTLLDKLKAELPGILNWALEGFKMFNDGQMVVPMAVKELTAKYRDDLNITKKFVDQYLVEDEIGRTDRGRIKLDDLYVMYQLFCKAEGLQRPLTKRMFKEDIGEYLTDQTLKARQPMYWGWRINGEYVPENILEQRFSNKNHAAKSLHFFDDVDD